MREFICRTHKSRDCEWFWESERGRKCLKVYEAYLARTREKRSRYYAEWAKKNPVSIRASAARWRDKNPEAVKRQWQEKTKRLKREAIENYGGKCQCCSDATPAFLTLDHTNDNGKQHRKETGSGQAFYQWLKTRGWPKDGLKLLCFNCNCGRRVNGGKCPHEG